MVFRSFPCFASVSSALTIQVWVVAKDIFVKLYWNRMPIQEIVHSTNTEFNEFS